MREAAKNPWAPLFALACVMVAVWIGLPSLLIGSFASFGFVEGSDGVAFLAVGLGAIAPGLLWALIARGSRASRQRED